MAAIGIDLGTTYSCVAVWQFGKVEIIANDYGNRTTPSYVAFADDSTRYVGEAAKSQIALNPTNTVYDAKRLIGKNFSDANVLADMKHWPFTVVNEDNRPKIQVQVDERVYDFCAEEISGMVLQKMRRTAEAYLGHEVKDAVITVPAYFNDSQRQTTKDAAYIAGLNTLAILAEPTAAALAYGLDKNIQGQKTVLIYDLGGGTFDVSILKISNASLFEVKSTAGDTHLGGGDFDNLLVDHLKNEFNRKYAVDISGNKKALQRLKNAAENAKRALSTMSVASVDVDALYQGIDFTTRITRARFEDMCLPLFQSTLTHVTDAIQCANMTKNDIDEIVLIGGSTRIPKIQQLLQNYFNGKRLNFSMNPDEAVAYGAAVKAAIVSGNAKNSHISNVILQDVAPLSLGVGLPDGTVLKVIERNTPIPCEREKQITTFLDYQKSICITIFEGERLMKRDNNYLGSFYLNGVPPAPRGVKIPVVLKLDENNILTVSATLLNTGRSKSRTLKKDKGRTTEAIDKMIENANRFKEEDEVLHQKVDAKSGLIDYTYHVKHAWRMSKYKLSYNDRKLLQQAYESSFHWLHQNRNASKMEYEYQLEQMKLSCSTILSRL